MVDAADQAATAEGTTVSASIADTAAHARTRSRLTIETV